MIEIITRRWLDRVARRGNSESLHITKLNVEASDREKALEIAKQKLKALGITLVPQHSYEAWFYFYDIPVADRIEGLLEE